MLFSKQIGINFYCIKNKQGEYWSNEFGWIKLSENRNVISPYAVYTTQEKEIYHLPIEGRWVKI